VPVQHISDAQIEAIVNIRASGETVDDIARLVGVSRITLMNRLRRDAETFAASDVGLEGRGSIECGVCGKPITSHQVDSHTPDLGRPGHASHVAAARVRLPTRIP